MQPELTKVALRYHGLYLEVDPEDVSVTTPPSCHALAFAGRLLELGYCLDERLLHALNLVSAEDLSWIAECISDVLGIDLNWSALVKGWDKPTREGVVDHIVTMFANVFRLDEHGMPGMRLRCGHFIPDDTFPLDRYTGCPFCGTPFELSDTCYTGQGSRLKELRLFTRADMTALLESLLSSSIPLDGTQRDSLKMLLSVMELPADVEIPIKETAVMVVQTLVELGLDQAAARFLTTPTDILRYLWYEKTDRLVIIEPKALIKHSARLYFHIRKSLSRSEEAASKMKEMLKLKYGRTVCRRVALWINSLPMSAERAAEEMNPKRGMWVRFIRALRLGEYSRREGMEHLARILDVFYKESYETWAGRVEEARRDESKLIAVLKERPGAFARCLFSTMLRYDTQRVLNGFDEITDKLPARLLVSLMNASEDYFSREGLRVVRPVTGVSKTVEKHPLLKYYSDEELEKMIAGVQEVFLRTMHRRYAALLPTEVKSIYIAPELYNLPLSVGDRADTVQDLSSVPQGTRFNVEGDAVRIFLHWGKGLPAQPIDLDISCTIAFQSQPMQRCYYGNLTCTGAKHSGDMRAIPDIVGTAEYIELSLPELEAAGATYVSFVCNAYTGGALTTNSMFGWMDSAYPMAISEKTGVAFDPSCVQHMIRIAEGNIAKGLVCGVLDVAAREIIWLEMPFTSQTVFRADSKAILCLLRKLQAKLTVGKLLELKAAAQGLEITESESEADEAYTRDWALNPAAFSELLAV